MKQTYLFTVLGAALLVSGCGSKFSEACEIANECREGNEADLDACIAESEALEEKASIYDCSEDFDAYAECVTDTIECDDDVVKIDEDCQENLEDLNKCISKASDLGGDGGSNSGGCTELKDDAIACCNGETNCVSQIQSTDFSKFTAEQCAQLQQSIASCAASK